MPQETRIGGEAREFPHTRWTLVLSAREGTGAQRRAMEELLASYWKPLYYFIRRKGQDPEKAKDTIQGFCVHLLEKDFLTRLDPSKGKLRGYLKTALSHYQNNLHESASALKRGGGVKTLPLEFDVAEKRMTGMPEDADAAYDREWATGIMERATHALRAEFESGERGGPFELVLQFFQFGQAPSYAEAAEQHNMSLSQLKAFLHRARTRFRELVRDQIQDTVKDPAEVDEEMRELLRLLSS